jgi:hypothetical protein
MLWALGSKDFLFYLFLNHGLIGNMEGKTLGDIREKKLEGNEGHQKRHHGCHKC